MNIYKTCQMHIDQLMIFKYLFSDTQSDMLESFFLDPLNDLTPSTLEDLSDDVSSLSSNTEEINTLLSPHSEDYSQFYCNYTEKPSSVFNYTDKPLSVFNLESPGKFSSFFLIFCFLCIGSGALQDLLCLPRIFHIRLIVVHSFHIILQTILLPCH